jgi:hypothetical protein
MPSAARKSTIAIEVVWADIAKAAGDVHVVGHYEGVMPQAAELALDKALSGMTGDVTEQNKNRLIVTDMTSRGILRGALGEVVFVPWGRRNVVAVAGMGRPGTFQENELRQLWRSVARTLGRLPGNLTIATVLIGSGVGNLKLPACVRQMLAGLGEALADEPFLRIGRVRIVEWELDRALKISDALGDAASRASLDNDVRFRVREQIIEGPGGGIGDRFSYSMLLAMLAKSTRPPARSKVRKALDSMLRALPKNVSREKLTTELEKRAKGSPEIRRLALGFQLSDGDEADHVGVADRITYSFDGSRVRCTAITNSSTVTERELGTPFSLVERSVARLNGLAMDRAAQETAEAQGIRLYRALVHHDLEKVINNGRELVIEVDPAMANVQWEVLLSGPNGGKPLAVRRAVARQLRTPFSPSVVMSGSRPVLKALVIADPSNPGPGEDLLGCREEAQQVAKVLDQCGLDVALRIGAAELEEGPGPVEGVDAADLTDAISDLISGEFDIVHYCGHAVFDPARPDRTGWVFADDFLSARYLEQMQRPPLLIFANACQTARLSVLAPGLSSRTGRRRAASSLAAKSDAGLVAGLADQFLKQGVSDYVGTGWEVPSKPAAKFATEFYLALFGASPCALGDAVARARNAIYRQRATFGATWAAYQHYGDPMRKFERGAK